jgi:hypothetical protein
MSSLWSFLRSQQRASVLNFGLGLFDVVQLTWELDQW